MKLFAFALILAQIIGTWRTNYPSIGGYFDQQISVSGGNLVVKGIDHKTGVLSNFTARLPVSQIACVTAAKSSLEIYGATQTSVTEVDSKNHTARKDAIWLSVDDNASLNKQLTGLEAAVPRVKLKMNACKGPVDLYHMHFVPPANTHDVTSWTSGDASMVSFKFHVSANHTMLFVDDTGLLGGKIEYHILEEVPFSQISCVWRHRDGEGLNIYPKLSDGIVEKWSNGRIAAESSIILDTDDRLSTQDVLDALENASPVIAAKLGAC